MSHRRPELEPGLSLPDGDPAPGDPGSRPRVLAVDDEPLMLKAIERVLAADYTVETATTAAEALALARRQTPDVVLSDISMPVTDGFALMEQMSAAKVGSDFILMTGMAEPDGVLVRAIRERAFYFLQKPFDREVLRALVARCVELRRLREARRVHLRRIEHELDAARRLQAAVLPPGRFERPGVRLSARLDACSELAGDLYDYAVDGNGRVAFLIGDIAGHGVSAAMLTAGTLAAFRSTAADGFAPLAVVRAIHGQFSAFPPMRFVTLLAGRLDPGSGRLEYLNAGHPPGLLRRRGAAEAERLDAGGPVVCSAFDSIEWEPAETVLGPGDRLLLYTDGITEASTANGQQFGVERLSALLCDDTAIERDNLLDLLFEHVVLHAGRKRMDDDLTALLVTRP